jgi:hypothetical protein
LCLVKVTFPILADQGLRQWQHHQSGHIAPDTSPDHTSALPRWHTPPRFLAFLCDHQLRASPAAWLNPWPPQLVYPGDTLDGLKERIFKDFNFPPSAQSFRFCDRCVLDCPSFTARMPMLGAITVGQSQPGYVLTLPGCIAGKSTPGSMGQRPFKNSVLMATGCCT